MRGLIPLHLDDSVWRSVHALGLAVTWPRSLVGRDSPLAPPPWTPLSAPPSWHALSSSDLWSVPSLSPSPALPYIPCVEGRQRATPHSSSFPPTTAPLQTLHMDVWGPARVQGQGRERYFLLVVDDYSRYTTVFPLRSKGEVPAVLIHWIRAVRLQLRKRFLMYLPVLRLHSDRGGESSSDLLRSFFMEVARTSMIHAAAPHFLWPFAVRYAAHQLNLWPCVSLPETSPTLRWTGEVGDASRFRVWGSCAFVRDSTAGKLSSRAIPCVFLGFPPDGPGWQFDHPISRRVFPSQDVTFDESVPFYRLFPYRTAPLPPPSPLFLAPGPPPVDPLPPQDPAPSGVSQVDPLPLAEPVEVTGDSGAAGGGAARGAEPGGAEPGGASPGGAEPGGAEPGGAASGGAAPGGTEPGGAASGGAEPGGAEPGGAGSTGRLPALLELEALELEALELEALELETLELEPLEPEAVELEALALEPLEPETLVLEALELEALELETLELEALELEVLELEALALEALEPQTLELEAPELDALELALLELAVLALERVPLPSPPASSLPELPDPESDRVRAASPTVTRFLATVVTDPSFESTAASALVAELVDFAAACRLDYAASLVAESDSVCPPSVGGECALGTDVLEDRPENFESLAAAVPHLVAWLLAPEGDPDALDIPTPRSYAEAISGPYSSQWQTTMDA
ncbi:unnamed protein product [Closterium sp. Yama58-4]|nr:unnamed protein product [Closterium sp. Yama58-4]